jgi:dihydrofolate reductase
MIAIVAADKNWGIGKEGNLLIHLPEDLRYFRMRTIGQVVIMGRKTVETLPGGKPLEGRDTIILTKDPTYKCEGCEIYNSVTDLLNALPGDHFGQEIYVAGGAQIYKALLPYCEGALVTKINGNFDADVFFPNLDEDGDFTLGCHSQPIFESDTEFYFSEYRRNRGQDPQIHHCGGATCSSGMVTPFTNITRSEE